MLNEAKACRHFSYTCNKNEYPNYLKNITEEKGRSVWQEEEEGEKRSLPALSFNRFISQLPPTQSREKLEELTQLHGYRHQQWEIFDNISKRKADLFVLTGALPRDPSVLAGSQN